MQYFNHINDDRKEIDTYIYTLKFFEYKLFY